MLLATITPRTCCPLADGLLHPSHVSRQLSDCAVRAPRALELENNKSAGFVNGEDIDRSYVGRELHAIPVGWVNVDTQLLTIDRDSLKILSEEIPQPVLECEFHFRELVIFRRIYGQGGQCHPWRRQQYFTLCFLNGPALLLESIPQLMGGGSRRIQLGQFTRVFAKPLLHRMAGGPHPRYRGRRGSASCHYPDTQTG